MKKIRFFLLTAALFCLILSGCGEAKKVDSQPTQEQEVTQISQTSQNAKVSPASQDVQGPEENQPVAAPEPENDAPTPSESADEPVAHVNKINITINPEANVIADENGSVTEVEFVNEDAETAYSDLELVGLNVGEAVELMVEAAAEHEFLQNGKPITFTLVDSQLDGQGMLEELTEVREAAQRGLSEREFDNSSICGAIELENVDDNDRTCDLCFGSGLLVCEECNGTTFLDGNAWTICGMCNGEGRTLCTKCEGAGHMVCDACGGSGADAAEADGKCFQCHGTGQTNCTRCENASGYQECYDCKGACKLGGLPCPHCNGTLWGICNRCNGSGTMK